MVATGPPVDPERDLRALDALYRETRTEAWTFVGAEGKLAAGWRDVLAELGLTEAPALIQARSLEALAPPPGVTRKDLAGESPTPPRSIAAGRSGAEQIAVQLGELLRLRARRGYQVIELGIEEAGERVASIALTVRGETAWLEDLETRADRRGRGHGRTLLRAAMAEAHRLGARAAGFSALADDWTWRWYEREGFAVVGRVLRLRRELGSGT